MDTDGHGFQVSFETTELWSELRALRADQRRINPCPSVSIYG